jgi:hypothetical protein
MSTSKCAVRATDIVSKFILDGSGKSGLHEEADGQIEQRQNPPEPA